MPGRKQRKEKQSIKSGYGFFNFGLIVTANTFFSFFIELTKVLRHKGIGRDGIGK